MDSLSERLKKLRVARGLSQEAVAGRLSISPQAVSKWENGRSLPDSSVIVPLANLLHVSTDELLGNDQAERGRYGEWDAAIPKDDPAEAAVIALQALARFPGDAHFLYRLAQAEHMSAALAHSREERMRFFGAAERHYQAVLLKFPEFEEAVVGLARVLNGQGRRDEAEAVVRRLPGGKLTADDVLLEILQGEDWEEHWHRVISHREIQLYQALLLRPMPETLALAEKLATEFPREERERLELLADVIQRRAAYFCEAGQEDAAMAELGRLKGLAERKKTLDEAGADAAMPAVYDENMEPVLRRPGWLHVFATLQTDPRLKPLAERPAFQELLRLAKELMEKEGA